MKKNRQIYLYEFRKSERITQTELAEFLGTSRSFLSLVESGHCKMPEDKIDMIMIKGRKTKEWNINALNPPFYRLWSLATALKPEGMTEEEQYFNFETGQTLFHIQSSEVISIKYGEKNISDKIADAILEQYPKVNREWLLFGTGSMFKPNGALEKSATISYDAKSSLPINIEDKIDLLALKLSEFSQKLDLIQLKLDKLNASISK